MNKGAIATAQQLVNSGAAGTMTGVSNYQWTFGHFNGSVMQNKAIYFKSSVGVYSQHFFSVLWSIFLASVQFAKPLSFWEFDMMEPGVGSL